MAVAVRAPSGRIVVRTEPLPAHLYTGFIGRTPFLRGLTMLWDSIGLGMRALLFSADVATEGEAAQMNRAAQWSTVGVALAFGIGLFFIAPVLLGALAQSASSSGLLAHVAEAVARLVLLVGYVGVIGLFPDIKRVYAYHGAEHMTIHAHEAGDALVPERIMRYPPAHPRCGTAFLLLVVAISILVFALVGTPSLPLRILSRIVLIPVIAGLAYEVLRFGGSQFSNPVVKLLVAPGLALQSLTTRYPDEAQVGVAVTAFRELLRSEVESEIEAERPHAVP